MFKRFFTKTRITLITILSLLSITSVGFASWTITAFDVDEEVVGSLESDIVIDSKEYVYLDTEKGKNNTGINCFDYQEQGYLSEDGTYVTDTGYIYTYYILNIEKCYELLKNDYNCIDVVFRIGYADSVTTTFNIFSDHIDKSGYRTLSVSCEDLNENIDYSIEKIDETQSLQYSVKLRLSNIFKMYEDGIINGEINFTIKYSFFATTGLYFNSFIFPHMYKEMIEQINFKVDVYLYGSNYTN